MKGLTYDQYCKILGVKIDATLNQVKSAYRIKARLYHPDLNKREDAADIFILVNEAYEYLSEQLRRGRRVDAEKAELIREWQEYRRAEARKRAYRYSKERYREFTKSKDYKTSMALNKVQLIINLSVAISVISMAVLGYIIKWRMVDRGYDPPTLASFIFLLSIGLIFLVVSIAHIKAFVQNNRKINSNEKKNK